MHYKGRNKDIIKVIISLLVLGILLWIVEMM
jgi:hypothetical protein